MPELQPVSVAEHHQQNLKHVQLALSSEKFMVGANLFTEHKIQGFRENAEDISFNRLITLYHVLNEHEIPETESESAQYIQRIQSGNENSDRARSESIEQSSPRRIPGLGKRP